MPVLPSHALRASAVVLVATLALLLATAEPALACHEFSPRAQLRGAGNITGHASARPLPDFSAVKHVVAVRKLPPGTYSFYAGSGLVCSFTTTGNGSGGCSVSVFVFACPGAFAQVRDSAGVVVASGVYG